MDPVAEVSDRMLGGASPLPADEAGEGNGVEMAQIGVPVALGEAENPPAVAPLLTEDSEDALKQQDGAPPVSSEANIEVNEAPLASERTERQAATESEVNECGVLEKQQVPVVSESRMEVDESSTPEQEHAVVVAPSEVMMEEGDSRPVDQQPNTSDGGPRTKEDEEGECLVGRYISRSASDDGTIHLWKVASYDGTIGVYTVVCEDGQGEELGLPQLRELLMAEENGASGMKVTGVEIAQVGVPAAQGEANNPPAVAPLFTKGNEDALLDKQQDRAVLGEAENPPAVAPLLTEGNEDAVLDKQQDGVVLGEAENAPVVAPLLSDGNEDALLDKEKDRVAPVVSGHLEHTDALKEQLSSSSVHGSVVRADDRKWIGQRLTGIRTIEFLLTKCKHLLEYGEIAKLKGLAAKLTESQDNSAVLTDINTSKNMYIKRLNDDHRRLKKIDEFQIQLSDKFAETEKIGGLLNEIKSQVDKLEDQYKLMPVPKAQEKLDKGVNVLNWIKNWSLELDVLADNEEFISSLEEWSGNLLKNTIWDHSPENTKSTILARSVQHSFDSTKIERFVFNPTRCSFPAFIQYLRDRLCDHKQFGTIESKEGRFDEIHEAHLLEYQTPKTQPPRWFILEIQNENASSDLYMRSDNLYMSAFTNHRHQIYELRNDDNATPLIRDSVFFRCKNDYPELMNYERFTLHDIDPALILERRKLLLERLLQLDIRLDALSRGVTSLFLYDHTLQAAVQEIDNAQVQNAAGVLDNAQVQDAVQAPQVTEAEVQDQIARIAITIPEVCRLLDLFDRVVQGGHLDKLLVEYMRKWKVMCVGIRNDEGAEFSEEVQKKIRMKYHYEAFPHLYLVISTKGVPWSKNNPKPDEPKPPEEPKPSFGPSDEAGSDSWRKGKYDSTAHDDRSKDEDMTRHNRGKKISGDHGTGSEECTMSGKPLFEVFSIHTNCAWVKHVAIFDDCCGKTVYKAKDGASEDFTAKRNSWLTSHVGRDASDFMDELVLNKCATNALSGFLIEVDVDEKDCVFHLPCQDTTAVDLPVTKSIFTTRGDIHVTSAILSNAMEVLVDVSFFIPEDRSNKLEIQGELVLRIDSFDVGCKIFCNGVKAGAFLTPARRTKEIEEEERIRNEIAMTLPLNRQILAIPVDCTVSITGVLTLGGYPLGRMYHRIQWKGNVTWTKFRLWTKRAEHKVLPGPPLHGCVCIRPTEF